MLTRSPAPDRGGALMLMPAAVLVLVILGAIVVDSAVVFLAQRELNNRAAGAANDAAALAFDEPAYYAGGSVCIDSGRAAEVVAAAFAPPRLPAALSSVEASTSVEGATVSVAAIGEVDLVFARAIPGVAHRARVHTSSAATARGAGGCLTS